MKNPPALLLVLLSMFVMLSLSAQQNEWQDMGKNFPDTLHTSCLSDISCVGDTCWITVCNTANMLYYSTDGCQTFTTKALDDQANAIHFLNHNLGYYVTQNGFIYKTTCIVSPRC